MRIYFLGAGSIGVDILRFLAGDIRVELVGVGTQLDKPAGRNRKLTGTPVALAAAELGLEAERLASVNTEEFLQAREAEGLDFIVVVAFGQLLKEGVLRVPKHGCVNVHASLLPKYRGASPVVSAVLNRDVSSGVSIMAMERGLDTGGVYRRLECELDREETAGSLEVKLGRLAAENLAEVLLAIRNKELSAEEQDHKLATHCRKISKQDGLIDWANRDAEEIEAQVRAFSPWPGAATDLLLANGNLLRVTVNRARVRMDMGGVPGTVLQADKNGLVVAAWYGALELLSLTVPGKKEMAARDFLNGYRLKLPKNG